MNKDKRPVAKGCAILAAIVVGVPLLIVGVVGVKTWVPLEKAGGALRELDKSLGPEAIYTPTRSGEIPAARMELFLELRASLVAACGDYGQVQKGFDSVESLESEGPNGREEIGDAMAGLGGAALAITPFLARYFELRNDALLAASMGLQEYAYIYAAAYHDRLLSAQTRNEIFCDGDALSPEASQLLQECLAMQLQVVKRTDAETLHRATLEAELEKMQDDPGRLLWQDGLPGPLVASVAPYRERLDKLFCGATAGLEMERNARRALRLAIE